MFLSYRYRIYPLRPQVPKLDLYLDELTYLWNYSLSERRDAWEIEKRRVTYLDQQNRLKGWRAHDRFGLGEVPYAVSRDGLQRLDLAFRAFFRRVKTGEKPGYPNFRSAIPSFTFVPAADPWTSGPNGTWRLKVPRLGAVPARRHREPPAGTVKSVTLRRDGSAWYATLQYEVPDAPPPPSGPPQDPVGVDLGLAHLATLSTGEMVESPGFYLGGERRLRIEQRRLSRKKRGSHRYQRQREKVARCHAKVRRQRRWMAHQLSHDWAVRFDLIAFEDLDVPSLMSGGRLSKSIADAGCGMLRQLCRYKAVRRSGRFVEVPAGGTTQRCSVCGRRAEPPVSLSDRIYRCPCGYEADRDLNAARNVLERGLHEVRRSTTELKRADGTPPPIRKGRRAYQRKREPTDRPLSPERAQQLVSGSSRRAS